MNSSQSTKIKFTRIIVVFALMIFGGGSQALAASPGACVDHSCRFVGKFAPGVLPIVNGGDQEVHIVEYFDGTWMYNGVVFARIGGAGWNAMLGDWDGDGYDEPGFHKNGLWFLETYWNGPWINGWIAMSFGSTDADVKPVAGDWNGNGIDSIGTYQDGVFVLAADYNNLSDTSTIDFGLVEDTAASLNTETYPIIGGLKGTGDRVGIMLQTTLQYATHNESATYDYLSYSDPALIIGGLNKLDYDLRPVTVNNADLGISNSISNVLGFLMPPNEEPASGAPCIPDYDCYLLTDPAESLDPDHAGKPDTTGSVIIPNMHPFD